MEIVQSVLVKLFWEKRFHLGDLSWESVPLLKSPCDDWKCCVFSVTLRKGASHFFLGVVRTRGFADLMLFSSKTVSRTSYISVTHSVQRLALSGSVCPTFSWACLPALLPHTKFTGGHSPFFFFFLKSTLFYCYEKWPPPSPFFKKYKGRRDTPFSLFLKAIVFELLELSSLVFRP